MVEGKAYQKRINQYRKILGENSAYCESVEALASNANVLDKSFLYVFAPALISYVNWVLDSAIKNGHKRLYFLSRDGWMMYKVASSIVSRRGLSLDIRYLNVSRYSARCAEYHIASEKALDTICTGGIDVTFSILMKRAMLSDDEISRIANITGYDKCPSKVLDYKEIQELKKKLSEINELPELIENHSKVPYEMTVSYFEREGLFDDVSYALVDSGWIGTLQRSIERIVNSKKKKSISGYYFGLYSIPTDVDCKKYNAFYFNKNDIKKKVHFSNCLFEAVFSAPEGMCTGYDLNGAVLSKEENPNSEIIVHFMNLINKLTDALMNLASINSKQIYRLFKLLMAKPTSSEAKAFGALLFSDDVLEETMQSIASEYKKSELKNNRFLRKILIKAGMIDASIRECGWIEGSIVLSNGFTSYNLSQQRLYKRLMYMRK